MPNSILEKFGTEAALTVTLASLATSSAGVGRQTTLVDLTAVKVPLVHVFFSIKLGTSPTAGNIYFYLLGQNTGGTTVRSDGAGASDAALTRVGAPLVYTAASTSTSTGAVVSGKFPVYDPGPWFGLLIVHDTGVALDGTGGNHYVAYIADNPEVQ